MTNGDDIRKFLLKEIPQYRPTRTPSYILKNLATLIGGCIAWSLFGACFLYIVAYSGEFDFTDSVLTTVVALSPVIGLIMGFANRQSNWGESEGVERISYSIYFSLVELSRVFRKDHSALFEICIEVLTVCRASRKPIHTEPLVASFVSKGLSRQEVAQALRALREHNIIFQDEYTLNLKTKARRRL